MLKKTENVLHEINGKRAVVKCGNLCYPENCMYGMTWQRYKQYVLIRYRIGILRQEIKILRELFYLDVVDADMFH